MWLFFAHELKYYFRNKQEAIYLYSYFISIVMLIPFAGDIASLKLQLLAVIALWVALASATFMASSTLFRRDQIQGRLEYYQLLPISMESLMLAKWLAFFCFVSLPLLASIPVAALLYGLSQGGMMRCALGLLAGSAALSMLSTLVAALTSALEKAGAVLSLILLPLSIPILIFGANYSLSSGDLLSSSLLFLIGFSGFILPVMCYAGAYMIRHSN